MNKAILMSIQPKWLVKILNGEKTIEIRKTMPKCKLPVDVYLYCTKSKPYLMVGRNDNKTYLDNGGKKSVYSPNHNYIGNRKIVAKFTLKHVSTCLNTDYGNEEILKDAYLTKQELDDYVGKRKFFAWHIDDLVVFDKPKELSEFYGIIHYPKGQFLTPDICNYGEGYEEDEEQCLKSFKVNKAPQSWQYIYIKGE